LLIGRGEILFLEFFSIEFTESGRSNIKLLLVILDGAKERAYPRAPYFRNGPSPLVSSPIEYCTVFDL
jgi:hypothetical protein